MKINQDYLENLLQKVEPIDFTLEQKIISHLNSLTKPIGSLGRLEQIAKQYCLIQKKDMPVLGQSAIVTFAADHGISQEQVSAYPSEVTFQMVVNMLNEGAAVNVLSKHAKIKNYIVDVGVAYKQRFSFTQNSTNLNFFDFKIDYGTKNFLNQAAMTFAQTLQAIEVGEKMTAMLHKEKVAIVGTGEMGIGNSSSAAAIFSALLKIDVGEIAGSGTGLDAKQLLHKVFVLKQALAFHQKKLTNPFLILQHVGGFEIAALVGLILSSAAHRMAVVVDGFISAAAALIAYKMSPAVKDYLFFSHASAEGGYQKFLAKENIVPLLHFDMRLGEGSGAALAIPIVEAAVKIYNEMATFASAQVSPQDK